MYLQDVAKTATPLHSTAWGVADALQSRCLDTLKAGFTGRDSGESLSDWAYQDDVPRSARRADDQTRIIPGGLA